ncbi:hypothetical protein MNBD_GAMMA21-531 [hydrothermal vent metagenome]|uniref:Uncharacterized protein n=1 Tax=hydrothermal vent metagenome TaxID=652676 RepID=A0A3B0ZGE7_9ZZZZ
MKRSGVELDSLGKQLEMIATRAQNNENDESGEDDSVELF